jgi:hypothetical protein
MTFLTAAAVLFLAVAPGETPAKVVQAPDSPVRLDRAVVLTSADNPPVLLYGATNTSSEDLDQFTVMAFIFKADGSLKARQVAPSRRTLEARGSKYSTMVLDGSPIDPTDVIVVGVNRAEGQFGSVVASRSSASRSGRGQTEVIAGLPASFSGDGASVQARDRSQRAPLHRFQSQSE